MGNRTVIVILSGITVVLAAIIVIMVIDRDQGTGSSAAAPETPPASSAAPPPPTPTPTPPQPWDEGRCLNLRALVESNSSGNATSVVSCDTAQALSKIVALTASGRSLTRCPRETDGIVDVPASLAQPERHSACVRNLSAPHPGDPGKGGGILRAGDCVYIEDPSDTKDSKPEERPCYDRYGPGKIWGLYKKKSQCKDAQGFLDYHYTNRRSHPSTPIVCTAEGYDVLTPGPEYPKGTCVKKPRTYAGLFPGTRAIYGGLDVIDCGAKKAWAKVTDSVSREKCPVRTTHTVRNNDRYPGTTCLRRL
jgi:hypothetical protein